jgi:tape measure domain-containing protein
MAANEEIVVQLRAEIQGFKTQLQQATDAISKFTQDSSDKLKSAANPMSQMMGGIQNLIGGYLGLQAAVRLVGKSFDASLKLDAFNSAMTNVLGTTEAAEDQFQKLAVLADKLGLDLLGLTDSYKSFAGATITAGLSQAQTNAIFNAFSTAGAAMKLSTDDIKGALTAVGQMFSKGTVSAEELRGQLGERLPGAFAIAAKSMGYNTQELGKLMAQGKIMATDLVPKMAAALETMYASDPNTKTDNLQASINRLNNAFTLAVKEGNVGKFFKMFVDGANQALKILESKSWKEFGTKFASDLQAISPLAAQATNDIYDIVKALNTLGDAKQLAAGTFKFTFTATELTKSYSQQIDLVKKLAGEIKNTAVFSKLSTAEQAKKVFQLEKERQLMTELGLINKNKKGVDLDLGTIGGLTEKIKQLKEESQGLKGKQLISKQTEIEKTTKDLKDLEFYAKNINANSSAGLDYAIAQLNEEAAKLPATSKRLAEIGVELAKLGAKKDLITQALTPPPVGIYNQIQAELSKLQEWQKKATNKKDWDALQESITATNKELEDLTKIPLVGAFNILEGKLKDLQEAQKKATDKAGWDALQTQINAVQLELDNLTATTITNAEAFKTIWQDAFAGFVQGTQGAFEQALWSGKNFTQNFKEAFLQMIKAMIAKLAAALVMALLLSVVLGGLGLGSIGAGAKILGMSGVTNFGTLLGSTLGSNIGGKVAMPSGSVSNSGQVAFEIQGDKLVGVLQNYNGRLNRLV